MWRREFFIFTVLLHDFHSPILIDVWHMRTDGLTRFGCILMHFSIPIGGSVLVGLLDLQLGEMIQYW